MEYLSGETVAQMMEGHKFLGFGKTMNIIVSVLKSLKKVHNAGVIHRDISPKNIIKTKEGKIVLIDFGAAKSNTITMSKTASIVLTQGFAPIEQYDNALSQGTWTDVYAVAATMYYMLTGITPDSANSRLVSDTLMAPSEIHPGLPDKLDDIISKALAVRPENRTQTAGELLDQIWSLRNAQNTTRKPKESSSEHKTATVNLPPTPLKDIKQQKKTQTASQQSKQWKKYAGGNGERTERFSETTEEQPKIITISKSRSQELTGEKESERKPLVPDKKKKKKKVPVPLIIAVVGLLLVLGGLVGIGYHDKQNNVQIPDFSGQNIEAVLSDRNYEFNFDVIYTYDPDKPLDTVVSQSPIASSRHVKKDTEVRLTVNSLKTEVNVPVLTKMSESVAVSTLKALYLESEVVIVNNDEFSDGLVVSSEPSNGSKVKVGTVVKIYVAQNSVAVPNLKGKTLQEATDELSAVGLSIGETSYDYSDEYDTGCIIAQGIEPDTKVVKGTSVSVMISSGRPVPITLEANVSLNGLGTPFSIKAVCDNVTEYERKRYSLVFEDSETISITRNINEGVKTVEIYIDDELYQKYSFDFENEMVYLDEQYEVSASKRRNESSKRSESSSSSKLEESSSSVEVSSEEPAESETSSEDTTTSSPTSIIFPLPFSSSDD